MVNENIIKEAVSKAIDDFLISEGFWDGVKNGIYKFADTMTNGEWNRKHGYYPNYKANNTYMSQVRQYQQFSRWMAFHRGQIWNKLHADTSHINDNYRNGGRYDWYDDYDYMERAKDYVEYNVTERNLVMYMNQVFNGWQITDDFRSYINYIRGYVNNPEVVMKLLNISYFRKNFYGKGMQTPSARR